ncbi:MAG: stage III sporulation protein AF [Lachnospiraceae bacterium]|jgi:stage III sporulation protein AF|nr:stage III sporulation protein AF [Lachnospiraceae bacterium]
MEAFYGWIRNIVCFLCILNVFLQVLPGGAFKKYVRFFGGLLLVVIVLNPLAELVKVSGSFEKAWRMESLKEEVDNLELTKQGMEEFRSEKINEAYKKELKRQIEEVVKAYDFSPVDTDITFEDGEDGVQMIREVALKIAPKQGEEISIPKVGNTQTQDDAENIKKEIQEVYHISMDNINIIVQE